MTEEERADLLQYRKDIFLTAYSSGLSTAHLASSFSVAEILYALFEKGILSYNTADCHDSGRDRLVMDKGHASLALYNILARIGAIDKSELYTFCKPGTRLGGEPNMQVFPFAEASTGSLGHGFSFGCGMAMAFKQDCVSNKVFVILGDGECEEGVIWEAVMSAAHFKLDNLTVILDQNRIQKMGTVEQTMGITDWGGKWREFGWDVLQADGHDVDSLYSCFRTPSVHGVPRAIIAHTVKGKGVSIMENNPDWHFKMPNKKELKVFMKELGISEEELASCRKHI